ncbi:MAG: hypothetical protein JWM78_927 [Verrucomicrobiaceae bacterium]|nr:hypothetical protein [Verrucomicrobiaceae bacterium]
MSISKADIDAVETKAENLIDDTSEAAERGVNKAKKEAKSAVDAAAEKLDKVAASARGGVSETEHHASEFANAAIAAGVKWAQQRSEQTLALSEESLQRAVRYVKDRPLQSVLIAASAGALLVLLTGAARQRSRDYL